MSKRKRAQLIEVVPDKLYQRGRFQSWPGKKKQDILESHNIGLVVNLWAKVDPEVTNDTRRTYIHFPMRGNVPPKPEQLDALVGFISSFIWEDQAVLIHCEAGVNRSCFLTACMVATIESVCGQTALDYVDVACGKVKINPKLRKFVLDHYS